MAEGEPSGWKLGIDYLALRRGGLRFRDFLVGDSEPLLLSLDSIEVRDIALEPEVYGEPADIKFLVKLEHGALRTRARFTPRKEGVAVDVTLNGSRIPVKRSRMYVPGVAWSEITGLLSLGLRYRLETADGTKCPARSASTTSPSGRPSSTSPRSPGNRSRSRSRRSTS
jgi:hypothetical protein